MSKVHKSVSRRISYLIQIVKAGLRYGTLDISNFNLKFAMANTRLRLTKQFMNRKRL